LQTKKLSFLSFGTKAAIYLSMESLVAFFSSLAEPGRLVVMGFSFISVALVLRKVLFPNPSTLNNTTKASVQVK